MLRIIRGHPFKGRILSSYLYQIPITLNIACFISSKIRKAQVKLSKNNPLSKVIKEKRSLSDNTLKPKKQATTDEGFQIVPKRNFTNFKVKKSQVRHVKSVNLNIIQEQGKSIIENIFNKFSIQPRKKKGMKDIFIFKKELLLNSPREEIPQKICSNNDKINSESISQPNIMEQSDHTKDENLLISKPNKPIESEEKSLPGLRLPTSSINHYKWTHIKKPNFSLNSSYLIMSKEKGKMSSKLNTIKKTSPHQVEYNLKKLAEKYSRRRIINEASHTSSMKENKVIHKIVNKRDEKQKILLLEKKKKMIKDIIKHTQSMKYLQKNNIKVSSSSFETTPSKQNVLNSSHKSNILGTENFLKQHKEISKDVELKNKNFKELNINLMKNKDIKTILEIQKNEPNKYQTKIKPKTKLSFASISNVEKANNFSHKDMNEGKNCRKKDDNLTQDIKRAFSTSTDEKFLIDESNSQYSILKKEAEQSPSANYSEPGSAILSERHCTSIEEFKKPQNKMKVEGILNNMHCANGPFNDLSHLNSDFKQIKIGIQKEIQENIILLSSNNKDSVINIELNRKPNVDQKHNVHREKRIYDIFDYTISPNNEGEIPKRNELIMSKNEILRKFNLIEFKTKIPNFLDLRQNLNLILLNKIKININDKWGILIFQELKDLVTFNEKILENLSLKHIINLHLNTCSNWNQKYFDALNYLLLIKKLLKANNFSFNLQNSSLLSLNEELRLESLKHMKNHYSYQMNKNLINFHIIERRDPILDKIVKENEVATEIKKTNIKESTSTISSNSTFTSLSSVNRDTISNENNKLVTDTSKTTCEEKIKDKLTGTKKNNLIIKTTDNNIKCSEKQLNKAIIKENKSLIPKLIPNSLTHNLIYPKKYRGSFKPYKIITTNRSTPSSNTLKEELSIGLGKKMSHCIKNTLTETKKIDEKSKELLPSYFNNIKTHCDTMPNKNISNLKCNIKSIDKTEQEKNQSFVLGNNSTRIKMLIQHPNSQKNEENVCNTTLKQDQQTGSLRKHLLEDKKLNILEFKKENIMFLNKANTFDEINNSPRTSFSHLTCKNTNFEGSDSLLMNKLSNQKKEKVTQDNELKVFCSIPEGKTSQNQCMHYCTTNKMHETDIKGYSATEGNNNTINKYVKKIESSFQNNKNKQIRTTTMPQQVTEKNFSEENNFNSLPLIEMPNLVKHEINRSYFKTKYNARDPNILHKNYPTPNYGCNEEKLPKLALIQKSMNNPDIETDSFRDFVKNSIRQNKMQIVNTFLLKQEKSNSFEDLIKVFKDKYKHQSNDSIINSTQTLGSKSKKEEMYFRDTAMKMLLKYATYKIDNKLKLNNINNSDFTGISEILLYEDNLFSKYTSAKKVNIMEISKFSDKPSPISISENDLILINTFIKETNEDKSKIMESLNFQGMASENQSPTSDIVYLPKTKQFKITNFKYSDGKITIKLPEVFIGTDAARVNDVHGTTEKESNFRLNTKSSKKNLKMKKNVQMKDCCNFIRATNDTYDRHIKEVNVDQNVKINGNSHIANEYNKFNYKSPYFGNVSFDKVGLFSNDNKLIINSSKSGGCKLDPFKNTEETSDVTNDFINSSLFPTEPDYNSEEIFIENNLKNKEVPPPSNNPGNSTNEMQKAKLDQETNISENANNIQDRSFQKSTTRTDTKICNEENKFSVVYSHNSELKINGNKFTKFNNHACKEARKTKILPEELPNQNYLLTAKINKQNHIRTISSDPTINKNDISSEDNQPLNTISKATNLDCEKNKLTDYINNQCLSSNNKKILLEDSIVKQNDTIAAKLNNMNLTRPTSSKPTTKQVSSIDNCNTHDDEKLLNKTSKSTNSECDESQFTWNDYQNESTKENEILLDDMVKQNYTMTHKVKELLQQNPIPPPPITPSREPIDLNIDFKKELKSIQSADVLLHNQPSKDKKYMENKESLEAEKNFELNKTISKDIKKDEIKATDNKILRSEKIYQVTQSDMDWTFIPETRQLKITNLKYTNGKETIHLPEVYINVADKFLINNNNEQLNQEKKLNGIKTKAEAKPSGKEKILVMDKDDMTKIKNNEITYDHSNKYENSISVRITNNSELIAPNKNDKNMKTILVSGNFEPNDQKIEDTLHCNDKTMRRNEKNNVLPKVLTNCWGSTDMDESHQLNFKNLRNDNVQTNKQYNNKIKSEIKEGERKEEITQFTNGFSDKMDTKLINKIKPSQKTFYSAYIKDDLMSSKIGQIEQLMKSVSLTKDCNSSNEKQKGNAIHASIAKRAQMCPPEDDLSLSNKMIREIVKGKNSISQNLRRSSVCQDFKNSIREEQKQVYKLPEIYEKENSAMSLLNNKCPNVKELVRNEQKESNTISKDMINKTTEKEHEVINKPANMNSNPTNPKSKESLINEKKNTTFIKLGTVASSSSDELSEKKTCFSLQTVGKLGMEMNSLKLKQESNSDGNNDLPKLSNTPTSEDKESTNNVKYNLFKEIPINNTANTITTSNKKECKLNNCNPCNSSTQIENNVPYKVIEKEMNIDKCEQNFNLIEDNSKINNSSLNNCNINNFNKHVLCHIPLTAVKKVTNQIKQNNEFATVVNLKEGKQSNFNEEIKNKIQLTKKGNENSYSVKHKSLEYYINKTENDSHGQLNKVTLSEENISKYPKNMPDQLIPKISNYRQMYLRPLSKIKEYDKVHNKNFKMNQNYDKVPVYMTSHFKESKSTEFPDARQKKTLSKNVIEMRMKTLRQSKDAIQKLLLENSTSIIPTNEVNITHLENPRNYSIGRRTLNFKNPNEINSLKDKSHTTTNKYESTETYSGLKFDDPEKELKNSKNKSDLSVSSLPSCKETMNSKSKEQPMYISNNTFHNIQDQVNEGKGLRSIYFPSQKNKHIIKSKPQKLKMGHIIQSMPRYQNLNTLEEEDNLRKPSVPAIIKENINSMKAKLQGLPSSMSTLILQKDWMGLPREVIYEYPQISKSEVFKTKDDKFCQDNTNNKNNSMDYNFKSNSIKYEKKNWTRKTEDDSFKKLKEKTNYNKSRKKIEDRLQKDSLLNNRKQNPHSSYSDLLSKLYSKYINTQ